MKKLVVVMLIVLGVGGLTAGVSAPYIASSSKMLTGMGAKLGCSGRYISGFSERQAFEDLQSYSFILKWVTLEFNDRLKRVSADFLGLKNIAAQYRPGLGCTLDIGDTQPLNRAVVATNTRSQAPWPRGDGAANVDKNLQQKLNEILKADNRARLQTRALLVVRKGQLVAESYSAGLDQHSKLLGWSMAKSVMSLLVGHMEMTGELDVAQRPVFSQWAEDDRRTISVRHLLQMSSGLEFPELYEPGAGATDMLFASYRGSDLPMAAGMSHKPGEVFEYSSGTTNLLSRLVFDASGANVQAHRAWLNERLMLPLALRDFVFEPDPSGILVGSSYLYASARDWARIGQLMLNGGQLNGYRLVSESWVQRARTPNHSHNMKSYGYQFWLNDGDQALRWPSLPRDSYASLGNRKQVVMMVPSEQLVIVRLGWTPGDYPTDANMAAIVAAAKIDESQTRLGVGLSAR